MKVQELGKSHFYSWYEIKVVKVERGYEWKSQGATLEGGSFLS
jgi:hypothetical protein